MQGPTARTISPRSVIVAAAAVALLTSAVLLLLPVHTAVEGNGSYPCSSPLVSSMASGAKRRWQVDTLVAKAVHPDASIEHLPVKAYGQASSSRLRWALFAGATGLVLAFGVLGERALLASRKGSRPAQDVVAATEHGTTEGRFRHLPALDGMRGLAVLAVLAFHGGLSWARGGFLGVDAFFVLSGYLITSLLLTEWRAKGSIALGAFWSRRARRLLPALLLVLAAIALYARYVSDPSELSRLRFDAFATLGYAANWRFIFAHVGYFGAYASPSPLRHMWSLAVEEQFYLVWPPFAVLVLSLLRSRRALFWITSALTLASVAAMQALYRPGVDPTRVYYGTDTRAQTVLIGAALASLAPDRTWGIDGWSPARTDRGRRGSRSVHRLGVDHRRRPVLLAVPRWPDRYRARRCRGDRQRRGDDQRPRTGPRVAPAQGRRSHLLRPLPVALADLPCDHEKQDRALGGSSY